MRTVSFLTLVLLTILPAFAQFEAKMIDFNNKLEINLAKESLPNSLGDKIRSVNVIDARDDSGAVGYYYIKRSEAFKHGIKPGEAGKKGYDSWSKIYYCSPTLKDGFAEWISAYLQCRKNDSVKNNLLIVVKKLWLSPEADKTGFDDDKTTPLTNEWDAGVLCKLEFYLERDSIFYPLYRIDSIFTYKDRLNDYEGLRFVDNAGSFITSTLKKSLVKLADINPGEIIAKRRKLSFNEIYREYSKKTEVPILKSVVLNKGVYKDFEEFKANSPSIREYELRESKMGDILYVKDGNSEYPSRTVWGFCDGTDIFINSGDKYSKLVRRENTFYFFGIKGLTRKSKHVFLKSSALNYAANTGEKKSVYKMELKYYQVDMETGEAY
ncbi:MAG: hypothetical protein KTQ13_03395 [Ferruginibacter sp.]|nr:hypothetical protein [Chitinophagaceae bacterium]MBP6286294.1 hypothetical protein [Ferruginibacter sp.]MBU9935672.1 hypothetical protein [Ferruginibacter sp.]